LLSPSLRAFLPPHRQLGFPPPGLSFGWIQASSVHTTSPTPTHSPPRSMVTC
jgi:hypothetical protein